MVYEKDKDVIIQNTGLKLFVDTSQELTKSNSIWANYLFQVGDGTLAKEDEASSTVTKAYPIYLVNLSNKFAEVEAQDGSLMMVLEAKNKDGLWLPIEYWSNSWCGNSYHSYLVPPRHMILAKGIKYTGSFTTTTRLKLMNGDDSVYSNQFNLSINLGQFEKHEKIKKGITQP